MNKNSLTDLVYAFEIASEDVLVELYLDDELSARDIIKISRYFINNLDEHHTVNGNVWNTMCGIIDFWNNSNTDPLEQFITDNQAIYLIGNLKRNIHQRKSDPIAY